MSPLKSIYRVFRSILFTMIVIVVGVLPIIYITLSIPAVTDFIKDKAEKELTELLGGKVTIDRADIFPFNEVRLHGVTIYTPENEKCISVERIGAGVELWSLLTKGKVVVSYAEVISLNSVVEKKTADSPLNIQFIIDAFAPKEQKEPSDVEITLHNVVIRKSTVAFRRPYLAEHGSTERQGFDLSNIELHNLNADLALPKIHRNEISIDVKRLAFVERSGFDVKSLTVKAEISPTKIAFSDFSLKTGSSEISVSDQSINFDGYDKLVKALKSSPRNVGIAASPVYLSDFSAFVPALKGFTEEYSLFVGLHGTPDRLQVNDFNFSTESSGSHVRLKGIANHLLTTGNLDIALEMLDVRLERGLSEAICNAAGVSNEVSDIVGKLGTLEVSATGNLAMGTKNSKIATEIRTDAGDITASGNLSWGDGFFTVSDASVNSESIDIGLLASTAEVGKVSFNATGSAVSVGGKIDGDFKANVPFVEFRGNRIDLITLEAEKTGDHIKGSLDVADDACSVNMLAEILLAGAASKWNLDADIGRFQPSVFGLGNFGSSETASANIYASLTGNNVDNIIGEISVEDLVVSGGKRNIFMDRLHFTSEMNDNLRDLNIDSDFLSGSISGHFIVSDMVTLVSNLLNSALPTLFAERKKSNTEEQFANIDLTLKPATNIYEILNAPVSPGVPVLISGNIDGNACCANLDIDAPYLIKGRNKLIKNSVVSLSLRDEEPSSMLLTTSFPMKKNMANAVIALDAFRDKADCNLRWTMENNQSDKGDIGIEVEVSRNLFLNKPELHAQIRNSQFSINGADWDISPAYLSFENNSLAIENLHISHGTQFIDINGSASQEPMDILTADLAGIDLAYIFDILNINYVDFGGIATGKAMACSLFSKNPVARTENLFVKNLAYNGCVVGDGNLEGHWDNEEKMVAINAEIAAADTAFTTVHGGIYVARDSLSLEFTADKTDIALLKPFMSGFTSSVEGKASGYVKLYGTFSDIDLEGKAFADTIRMKVDYTDVYYGGSDSVFFTKGKISIPHIRLYDKYGNSAHLKGEVTHRYLHDAAFRFELTDARNLLVYNTNASSGNNWYGKVFADGGARLWGVPGVVRLDIDMTTSKGTDFTISLDDTRTAAVYSFLTFSDRRKSVQIVEKDSLSFEKEFYRRDKDEKESRPDLFSMDLAIGVTPEANMTLVMDPASGDKIKASGNGALQMHYDSDTDNFTLYGKYVLERGDYNFSLQDLILKNFTIKPGSSISFNGDPMAGVLEITASHRVNTNLADLDASFRNDPELNRTVVPVDALLKVSGEITSPEIKFDIELPTVTSEVERKMRSIISTEEMLNQQVIYLLALNRFYSPEYSTGERGGELASVASSTLSSQIQNFIGSVTDKFTLAPSLKSDKSDFSDMEFDVALSSKLFNDRLLLNGNLGYRDKSTSQTTFVGDFDLEYLLTKNGNLRLKAYNHFNDASYYLKSALTTQGIGIVYRRDFDRPFDFIKDMIRKRKEKKSIALEEALEPDTTKKEGKK